MNYYINKLLNYCFYCIRTKNVHYDLYDDNKINYNNPVPNHIGTGFFLSL